MNSVGHWEKEPLESETSAPCLIPLITHPSLATHRVKYATDSETNMSVAIKILDKEKIQKQNMGNQIKKEISIMKVGCLAYLVVND
jgi:hypothetical protein